MIIELLQYPFFIRALVVGVMMSVLLSWMSGYTVLRREVFFGHAVSHMAFLGVAVAVIVGGTVSWYLVVASVMAAVLVYFLQRSGVLTSDSLLEMLAQFGLVISVLLLALFPRSRVNIEQFLFGDILAITTADLWGAVVLFVVVLSVLLLKHRDFLRISLSQALSHAVVRRKTLWQFVLIMLIAVVIGLSMRIVGILLISAFLTVPANIGKLLATSMRQVFVWSVISGVVAMMGGILLSGVFDVPTGAAIVALLIFLWCVAFVLRGRRRI